MRRCAAVSLLAVWFELAGCVGEQSITRLTARPKASTAGLEPGPHTLSLGGHTRDGTLYVPRNAEPSGKRPLLVLLHGGGGRAADFRSAFPIADRYGIAVLAVDSRDNTWDGIDGQFRSDVMFIDAALAYTFENVDIDPQQIALGGVSDGGFYAISIGLVNGDLFTHIVAVAPGRYAVVGSPVGRPLIFVAHGIRDNVYPTYLSRSIVVPKLRAAGYDVTYREFDGPHSLPPELAAGVMEWMLK